VIRFLKRGISAEQDAAEQSRVRQTVESIIADIEKRGDAAVREFALRASRRALGGGVPWW